MQYWWAKSTQSSTTPVPVGQLQFVTVDYILHWTIMWTVINYIQLSEWKIDCSIKVFYQLVYVLLE